MQYTLDGTSGVVFLVNPNRTGNIVISIMEALEVGGYLLNQYYPLIINGCPVYAYINSQGFLHYILNGCEYALGEDNIVRPLGVLSDADLHAINLNLVTSNPYKGRLGM